MKRDCEQDEIKITFGLDKDTLKAILTIFKMLDWSADVKEIKRGINTIMASQAEFDAQITAANEKLDSLGTSVAAVGTSVTDEAQQIRDFIASLPPDVDTSALQGVVDRLTVTANDASLLSESVGGIFTPPA